MNFLGKSVLARVVLMAACIAALGIAVPRQSAVAWGNVCPQPYMNWIVTATCARIAGGNPRATIEITVAARDSSQAIQNAQVSRTWNGCVGSWRFSARLAGR